MTKIIAQQSGDVAADFSHNYGCQDYQEQTPVTFTALVDNTFWQVQEPYHPVPWKFCADGTVSASNLWLGIWQMNGEGWSIRVDILHHENGLTDSFSVVFSPNGQSFTAFKDGKQYRIAERIS